MKKRFFTEVGFALSFHFVCSLTRKCKGCLFTFFSLWLQFESKLKSIFALCIKSEKKVKRKWKLQTKWKESAKDALQFWFKVKRQPLHFLFKLQTKWKESEKVALHFLFKMQTKWKESEKASCFNTSFFEKKQKIMEIQNKFQETWTKMRWSSAVHAIPFYKNHLQNNLSSEYKRNFWDKFHQ